MSLVYQSGVNFPGSLRVSTDTHLTHDRDADFDCLPVLSQIETDRFCEGCGYNLRMQGVRRNPRLEILVVRCPECNRYHPVAPAGTLRQIWWQRFAGLLMVGYALLLLSVIVGFGLVEFGITVGTIEMLGAHTWDPVTGQSHALPLYQRPDDPDYAFVLSMAAIGSLLTGYVAVALATIACHHWPRWGYAVFAAAIPLTVTAVIWALLMLEVDDMMSAVPRFYAALLASLQIVGGLLAVRTGRPVARGVIRLLLPPNLRTYMAFLWSADNLQPPQRQP
ncbi:MAG TPA: hypothetical protein PK579_19270 [Phycisphaerae bacterium]|jgi:hypothetical protein|nr:hypothetical protein [Phycisphaerae bacterium]